MQQLDSLFSNRAHDTRHPTARHPDQVTRDPLAPADTLLDHAPDSGPDRQPISDSANSRLDTHWTRILFCDVFTAHTDLSTPDRSEHTEGALQSSASDFRACAPRGQGTDIPKATKDSSRKAGSDSVGSRSQAAMILFAIVIAMCLAVFNVLVSTEAIAVVPHLSLMPISSDTDARPPTTSPGVKSCP